MFDFQSAFQKKFTQRYLMKTPHYLIPGLNQQRTLCREHCSDRVTHRYLQCVEPKLFIPKTETPRIVVGGCDVATNLVKEKLKWQEKAKVSSQCYKKNAKGSASLELLHGKVLAGLTDITVPRRLAEFVNHVNSDPDPDFFGAYNWYYTEGTLSVVCLKKKAFIISVQGRYLDKICSVPLEENNGEWKPCLLSSVTKRAPIRRKPIYQIKAKEVKGRAVVGVRQRNVVAVYLNSVQRTGLNLAKLHGYEICENERPLSGLDLDSSKLGHFCSSHSDRTIKIWDPARRIPLLEGKATRNMNCKQETESDWCGVWYDKDDNNQVIVADSCCVTWHDVRCGFNRSEGICLMSTKHRLPLEISCEEVSLLVPSQLRHQLYLGTTHSLLQIDKRRPTLAPQPVRRWTHMLNGQLLMGQTVPLHGTKSEIICVSCPQQAVVVSGGEMCCSQQPPLCVPHTSVTQGMVGLSFLPHPYLKRNDIITQMGCGDIYSHSLQWNAGAIEKPVISDEDYYCKPSEYMCTEGRSRQLQITGRCNMQPVYLGLQGASKTPHCNGQHTSYIKRQSWQRSKAELTSYVDILAPGMLDAWGIDDMEEWSPITTVPSAVDKVQQWLQMNSTSLNPVVEESEVTTIERVQTGNHALPASQFLEETEKIDLITTHCRISQSNPEQTPTVPKTFMQPLETEEETVLPPYNSTDFLNASGGTTFQLSPNVALQSRLTKTTSLKRKSQVLGF